MGYRQVEFQSEEIREEMIRMEFSSALTLYILLTTIALLVYWLSTDSQRGSVSYSSVDKYLWQCSICTYFYIDSRHRDLSVCPRCGSYNEKGTGYEGEDRVYMEETASRKVRKISQEGERDDH